MTVIHFCDLVWSCWLEANILFIYIWIVVWDLVIKVRRAKIALMCLIPPYVFLSQTITLLSNVICSGLCMFYMSGKEVVECFVDIGIIVNHYCLDILYITTYKHALTLLQCCSYTVDITPHKKHVQTLQTRTHITYNPYK